MLRFLETVLRDRRRRALVLTTATLYVALVEMHRLSGLGTWAALYESMRVFTFDASWLPTGHSWLDVGHWLARLAAPIVTLGIAAEVVDQLGLMHLPMLFFQLRGRDHVVVVGAGRLGRHLCERLHLGGVPVIAVERDAEADHVADLRRHGIPVLIGDGTSRETLRVARVAQARTVIACTASDLVNLEIALAARDLGPPNLDAYAHVVDDRLRDRLTLRAPLRVFSSFEWAAAHAVDRCALPGEEALFVIAGYGRLGRAVLRRLLAKARGAFVVLDPALEADPDRDPRVEWIRASMFAPEALERLRAEDGRDVRFLVCTDRGEENLRFALEVLDRLPGRSIRVFLRMFRAGRLSAALPDAIHVVEMAGVIDRRVQGSDLLGFLAGTAHRCEVQGEVAIEGARQG